MSRAACPACDEPMIVHEREDSDESYCPGCGHEEVHKLDRPRPIKPRATEPPAWRQDKVAHPSRKGRQRAMQEKKGRER